MCRNYPIEILFCANCCTAHQKYQVPKSDLFPGSYHYRSRFTADVLSGMAQLVRSCRQRFGSVHGKTVLDVGCNDGSLLDLFKKEGATTLGVEPTDAHLEAQLKGHVVWNEFLSTDLAYRIVTAHGEPCLITFTNVFAHINDLAQAIEALKRLMGENTVLVIENHYLGAVLDGNQFDTFYHEHLRTYSSTSFQHIADSLDVALLDVEFPARYGGNIRVFLGNAKQAKEGGVERKELPARESRFVDQFESLCRNIDRWREHQGLVLEEEFRRFGRLAAKAFPARAAILIRLLALDEETIEAVYEKSGSLKIGHYVPGTRIPIRSDDELFASPDGRRRILNLAWHISREIGSYMAERGYTGEIIDILSAANFDARVA
jgi:SAM-dependent methyltransferase